MLSFVELELVGNLCSLLVASFARTEHLTFQLEALEILSLLLGRALELQLGAGLDGLIMHLLKPLGYAVTAIYDLIDPVTALRCPDCTLSVGFSGS